MKLNDFINKNLNKKIDYDKVFGSQCVDVFRQYCEDVLNIPHTGSVEGAKDLYLNYEKLPLEQKCDRDFWLNLYNSDKVKELYANNFRNNVYPLKECETCSTRITY